MSSISDIICKVRMLKRHGKNMTGTEMSMFEHDIDTMISELQREEQSVWAPAAVYIPPPPKPVVVYNSCTINVHGCGKCDMAERCLGKSVRDEMVRGMNGARLYK